MKKKLILNIIILILFFLLNPCSATDIPVTFNVSSTVSIGGTFMIQGYTNTTGTVDVSLEDKLYSALNDIPIKDKNFSKEIDTSEYAEFQSTGYLILRAYVNRDLSTDIGQGERNDGLVGIVLTGGSLTAKTSTTIVSPGSDFTISGIAKGSKNVDVLIIPPDGNYGSCIEDGATTINSTSIYYKSPIVSNDDNTYSLEVVTGDKIDTGNYFVIVLTKGDDNIYGKGHDDITAALSSRRFINKLQDQVIDIIEDATYGAVASDDFYWTSYVKVASESVVLDSIQDVVVGSSLKVTGTSSKEDGYSVIVMVIGQTVFPPQTTKVTSNRFSMTFSTANAIVGSYTIEADDGDGHTDELTIKIVPKPVVTPKKVATPIPTEEVTPKPTEVEQIVNDRPKIIPTPIPTLGEVPGVGIIFTIISLLIVAYLVRYKKR